jgi:ArsR family transcriptional regulator, arsenate/arsenite/antimonite-responsive transcriptional repressor
MPAGTKPVDDAKLVRVLKALAHAKRFQMVHEIARAGELSCGQIGELFPVAQPTISHHLKILHDAGLLLVRRQAQHAFISVDHALIEAAVGGLPRRLKPVKPKSRANR